MPSLFFVAAAAAREGRSLGLAELQPLVVEDDPRELPLEEALVAAERDRVRVLVGGEPAAQTIASGSVFFRQSRLAQKARWGERLSAYDGFLAPLPADEKSQAYLTQAVLAISDAYFYPAPLAMMLTDFNQVQASVFQVARAPGKNVVYLGCALLIIGVFAMLYVRDRRLWIWLTPRDGGSHASMALSTNRKTLDGDREFGMLADKLIGAKPMEKKTSGGSV